jgi:hypothetical protein
MLWRLLLSLELFRSLFLDCGIWLTASEEFVRVGSAYGARGASRSGWLVGPSDLSLSERPKPKRRLIGLIGGTGGGTYGSEPFFRDAPAGRLTVSMTEVVERKTGSEISDLAMDFLRNIPCLISG